MAVEIMLLFSTIISLVLLVLTGLKLAGLVNISWVWVFAPIWLPFILLTGVMLIILTVVITKTIIERRRKNEKDKLAKSGQEYHKARRKYFMLPRHISKQFGKYRVGIQIDGRRYRKTGFDTIDDAVKWRDKLYKTLGKGG